MKKLYNLFIKGCVVALGFYLLIYVVSLKQTSGIIFQIQGYTKNQAALNVLKVKEVTNCLDKPMVAMLQQRGDYWVLYNYIKANKFFKCHESVTYTTHADYTFIDNLLPLLERWKGPISLALHAPGTDFESTIESIAYLRECTSPLVKDYVTFHIYFSTSHVPNKIPMRNELFTEPYNCSKSAPFLNVSTDQLYKTKNKLLYPVNVGRNVAREMARTHFIFASDIELYPSPNTITQFLEMIAENNPPLQNPRPRVFTFHLFEINADQQVPNNKTMLQEMLVKGTAIPFHKKICQKCHTTPKNKEWISTKETQGLHVFHVGKRMEKFGHWEPIFIGTNAEPLYDERLSWEGRSDKMTQGYTLCVLDYDFMILDNAFLVHKPGIKVHKTDLKKAEIDKTNHLIKEIIIPELTVRYGNRKGCTL